jgi:hypothetical protein
MLRRGQAFNGYSIEALDGKIGTVSDFLFDESTWRVRWLVVDTGPWLTGRRVILHPQSLEKPDLELRAFPARLTRAQIEASPGIAEDMPVSMQMDIELSTYYGWESTSLAGGLMGGPIPPAGPRPMGLSNTASKSHKSDRHLRSIIEVTNYAIHAVDGAIGHLETFLIEDEEWTIRYLLVNTSNWWHGRHVLIEPALVKDIDWGARAVSLDMTRYKIKISQPWATTGKIDQDYEALIKVYKGADVSV